MALGGASGGPVWADVIWPIVTGPEVGAQVRNRRVDRAVAQAYAALARREAGRLNRDEEFTAARDRLTHVAQRIQRYAGDDAELNALARKLQEDAQDHQVQMSPGARKFSYMTSERSLKGRDVRGAATRRPNRPA